MFTVSAELLACPCDQFTALRVPQLIRTASVGNLTFSLQSVRLFGTDWCVRACALQDRVSVADLRSAILMVQYITDCSLVTFCCAIWPWKHQFVDNTIFCSVTLCDLVQHYCFGGTYCFRIYLSPEDRRSEFLRNTHGLQQTVLSRLFNDAGCSAESKESNGMTECIKTAAAPSFELYSSFSWESLKNRGQPQDRWLP